MTVETSKREVETSRWDIADAFHKIDEVIDISGFLGKKYEVIAWE
ncbi:MAG: hypothetical protein NT001_06785 [Candidatus Woesearchaeota archaeon]|nr:hypothetical protein [Candidatus Woesearchaeota archaeon]